MADNFYSRYPVTGSGGSGVSSLNSLTGALTLVAGSGITITPSGSNITIAATGGGGMSTDMSNMASPTAASQSLIFSTGTFTNVQTKSDSAATQGIALRSGTPSVPNVNSGQAQLRTGFATGTGASGSILIQSGGVVDGLAGDIVLQPGLASGTGTPAVIQFQNSNESLGAGAVWTLTDTNGSGHWAASGSGSSPGGTNGAVQFNSSGSFGGDASNLFWDNSGKFLGIDVGTPLASLQIGPWMTLTSNGNSEANLKYNSYPSGGADHYINSGTAGLFTINASGFNWLYDNTSGSPGGNQSFSAYMTLNNSTNTLAVSGIVQSTSGGFKFPDNTVQTTAATGGSGSSGVAGTVQFSDGSGGFSGDASNLWWDNSGKYLGVAVGTPKASLQVGPWQVSSWDGVNQQANVKYNSYPNAGADHAIGSGKAGLFTISDSGLFFLFDNTARTAGQNQSFSVLFNISNTGAVQFDTYAAGAAVFDSSGNISSVAPGTSGNVLTSNGSTWVSQAAAGGSSALSGLTAATGTNSIDNLNFAQTWNWNTLTTQTAMAIASNHAVTSGILLQLTQSNSSASGNCLKTSHAGSSGSGVFVDMTSTASSSAAISVNSASTGGATGVDVQMNGASGGEVGYNVGHADASSGAFCYRGSLTSGSATGTGIKQTHSGTSGFAVDVVSTAGARALRVSSGTNVALEFVGAGNSSTTATAGGGQVLPLTVLGYLVTVVGGTTVKIPYYSV